MPQRIPYHDFGGDGPLLHFAHPNAYTPETFRQFVAPFLDHFHVIAMYHRPLWPSSDPDRLESWDIFAEDMVRFFEQEGLENMIGLGHSLGGVATAYTAVSHPHLFRQLVLVDPVFLPPQILEMAAAHPEDVPKHMPLVGSARRRRNRWASRQAAFDRFRPKQVFARWSDEALWDYVNESLGEDPETGEIVLRFPREWEAQIYAHPPLRVWETLPSITQPTLAVRAAASDTLNEASWQLWQELQPNATFVEIPDVGHMMMMERPLRVAHTILDHLKKT